MNATMTKLAAWGCDINGVMERFMDDEDFFLSLLPQATEDIAFAALGEALKKGNAKDAFEHAHRLKGLFGNMGLTPMYVQLCKIIEPLRAGHAEGLEENYQRLIADNEKLKQLISAD